MVLPNIGKGKGLYIIGEADSYHPGPLLASIDNITNKNLFDPERGKDKPAQAEPSNSTLQRIEGTVLTGTFITENDRYAVLQLPPALGRTKEQTRFRLGDMVIGFELSEIDTKKVVLRRGSLVVDLPLDFYAKAEEIGPRPVVSAPATPEATPRVQREGSSPAGTEKFLSNFGRFQPRDAPSGGAP